MQLVRYNPHKFQFNRQNHLTNFFDGFFDDFFGPAPYISTATRKVAGNGLQVDIYEKENVIVITAELPGVAKEDIKLDVKGKHVTLGGEKKCDEELKDEHHYRRERTFGKFERTFSLPFEIDADKVAAKYENGILRLEIPKPEEKQPKQIAIN